MARMRFFVIFSNRFRGYRHNHLVSNLPCHSAPEDRDLPRASVELARQVVWAWHLGVVVGQVELDIDEAAEGFIDYGELWDDDSWLETMWTASLCAADTEFPPGPGTAESDTVQEILAWAAVLDGSLVELEPAQLEAAERRLRARVAHRLRRPELAAAVSRVARALAHLGSLNAAAISRLLGFQLPLGAGRRSFIRPSDGTRRCSDERSLPATPSLAGSRSRPER